MICLKNPYPGVLKNNLASYGGSQQWSDSPSIRKCGCGLVAALDSSVYLMRVYGGGTKLLPSVPAAGPIPLPLYNELLGKLWKKYIPVVPPFGINPTVLTLCLNRFFHEERIPFLAHVAMATDKMWSRIEESLASDLPVILAIGQNFPQVWQKNKLLLHTRRPDGCYSASTATKAHFVVITGMDEEWLCVSSWGSKYYVNRKELTAYVKEHSTSLISGIVYMTKKK